MRRRALLLFVALAAMAPMAFAANAGASRDRDQVSIVEAYFTPATIAPGDTTTATVTVGQTNDVGANGTISLSGLDAAGLTFVGNGDTSAHCISSTWFGGFVICTYSDMAHGYKSDHFDFTSNGAQPLGPYNVGVTADVFGKGTAWGSATITYARQAVLPPPPNGAYLCNGDPGGNPIAWYGYGTQLSLMSQGYWSPYAVSGSQAGGDNISDQNGNVFHLVCLAPGTPGNGTFLTMSQATNDPAVAGLPGWYPEK